MRRQILFRGKCLPNGEFNHDKKWVYGDYAQIRINGMLMNCILEMDTEPCQSETIGQFTGRFDKKAIPIYEDDVVEYYDDIEDEMQLGVVYYEVDTCAFMVLPFENSDEFILHAAWEFEVKGNIHDNLDFWSYANKARKPRQIPKGVETNKGFNPPKSE